MKFEDGPSLPLSISLKSSAKSVLDRTVIDNKLKEGHANSC